MALDATRMVNKGHLIHTDVKQFIDLLTGVMTDQAVTLNNSVFAASMSVGGTLTVTGGPSTFMFGAVMYSGAWQGNGSVPPGGASGQVLSKSAAGDYAVAWTDPSAGVTWPLLAPDGSAAAPSYAFASNSGTGIYSNGVALGITTGGTFRAFFGGSISFNAPLQFSTDNTYDIGANSSARPRSIYAATSVVANASTPVTIGTASGGAYIAGAVSGSLSFGTGGNARWNIDFTNGSWLPQVDNTPDLGSAGKRVKDGYFAGILTAPTVYASNVWTTSTLLGFGDSTNGTRWRIMSTGGSFQAFTDNAFDIGAAGANRPRTVYAATSFIGPGAVPVGGTTGQALTKSSATDYALAWASVMTQAAGDARYLPLTGGTLTGPGNLQVNGTMGIGVAPVTYSGLIFQPVLAGANQFAFYAPLTFSTTGTGNTFVVYLQPTFAASTRTVASGVSVYADAPTIGAGVTVTSMIGLYAANQGKAGVTNAYGVYIAAQSGAATSNVGLWNQGTSLLGGTVYYGSAFNNLTTFNSGTGTSLMTRSMDGYVNVAGLSGVLLSNNVYYDGTSWIRMNTTSSVVHMNMGAGGFTVQYAPAGTGVNPPWTQILTLDSGGNATFLGTVNGGGGIRSTNGYFYLANGAVTWQFINDGTNALMRLPTAGGSYLLQNTAGSVNWLGVSSGGLTLPGVTQVNFGGVVSFGQVNTNDANIDAAGTIYFRSAGGAQRASISSGVELAVQGNIMIAVGNTLFFEASRAVMIRYRSDLGGVEIPYANGTYTPHVHFNAGGALYLEGGNNVYVTWRGDLGCIYLSYPLWLQGNASVQGTVATTGAVTAGTSITAGNGMALNLNRGANQATINFYNWAGSGYDSSIFSENGNFYFWFSTVAAAANFQHQGGVSWQPLNASAYNVASSEKIKRDMVPINPSAALATVLDERVTPIDFRYTWEDTPRVGFVAEDMAKVVPQVVGLDDHGEPLGINYGALVPVLWGALREMHARLEAMEAKLAA